jgi:hypothetical protein
LRAGSSPGERLGAAMESVAVFHHHIYEYQKGLRNLVLFTCHVDLYDHILSKLNKYTISHRIYRIGERKINVFFGDETCIEVIDHIGKADLSSYTDEEDFILGIMLGYCRHQQCSRYMQRKYKKTNALTGA